MLQKGTMAAVIAAALIAGADGMMHPASAFEMVEAGSEESVALVIGSGQLVRVSSEFSSVFVANPEVADIQVSSPRLLYLTGVGVGETTLFAIDESDNVLMSTRIRVTHNTSALQQGISRVAPGQGISASTVDQSLILTGTAASPEQAANVLQVASQFVDDPARIVNRMSVAAPTQVNLQVRIAEVSRNLDRSLGIRWNAVGVSAGSGSTAIGLVGGGGESTTSSGGTLVHRGPRLNLDIVLQALADEGMVSILAEPNLTARSGEAASFLAGGEYPYAVPQESGYNTIEFKDFGISLDFTPTVLDNGRISLKVATRVSELNFANNATYPSLTSRRAETTVDLGSGQSFAIAGLMQNRSSQNAARLPGLSSIPVLGALFRSSSFLRGQTELVILVTPLIVEPTTGRRLSTPVDNMVLPNDFERIVHGRFQGNAQATTQIQNRIGSQRLHGSSGFVFE